MSHRRSMNQLQHKQMRLLREKCPLNFEIWWICYFQLTQQHVLTVIWMVFLPGWQTCFRYRGRWVFLFSPRSISNGVELADTWTLAGQLVFICRSSWWKHLSWSSRSDRHMRVLYTVGFSWNTWLLTARLCSSRNGGRIIPSRTGKVNLSSSPAKRN